MYNSPSLIFWTNQYQQDKSCWTAGGSRVYATARSVWSFDIRPSGDLRIVPPEYIRLITENCLVSVAFCRVRSQILKGPFNATNMGRRRCPFIFKLLIYV